MERARGLQLCRSTVVTLPSAQSCSVSFWTSCVHLITLPTHSRWLKCCFVILKTLSVLHGSGAMEERIDELEGRLAAINDKLSGVVNQFNGDKQKFKDETEFEFAQHKLVPHEVVEGA